MCERRERESLLVYFLRYVVEQPKAILAVIGFAMAWVVYVDFKQYIYENTQCQRETAKALSELALRVQELEARYDKFHPVQK